MRWLNWIVFDHLLIMMAQSAGAWTGQTVLILCIVNSLYVGGQRKLPGKLPRKLRAKGCPNLSDS